MSGLDNINNLPNLSTQIVGAGAPSAAKKVSRNSTPVEKDKGSEIPRNGATVNGNGIDGNAAGQALLGMMANGITPTSGFFKGKIQEKDSVKGEATIETHAAALPLGSPEAKGQFQQTVNLASRGDVSGERTPYSEILLGRDVPGAEIIKQALILDAKAHGIPIGIDTKEATKRLVQLFHAQPDKIF
ncbi:MAG: hypothetical protein ACOYK1_07235 [Vampirovibrionia bacterium]|jgi:hypothetical protein